MRQVVLDTETTGLETRQDHRIIEIGAVEVVNRRLTGRTYHQYINPEREIDEGARAIHGISNQDVENEPVFADVAEEFLEFVDGAELIIHNAPFDVGFLNYELSRVGRSEVIEERCAVLDSLVMARKMHPGQKNSLDALCRRYYVDNSAREKHGALLDAEILADVYLLMTGGQVHLGLSDNDDTASGTTGESKIRRVSSDRPPLKVIKATEEELAEHRQRLQDIQEQSQDCLWLQLEAGGGAEK